MAQTPETLTTDDLIAGFRRDFPAYNKNVYFLTGEDTALEPGRPSSIASVIALLPLSLSEIGSERSRSEMRQALEKFSTEPETLPFDRGTRIVMGFTREGFTKDAAQGLADFWATGGKIGKMIFENARKAMGGLMAVYDLAGVFDHEVGHIVTKGRSDKHIEAKAFSAGDEQNNYDETRADVYSMIRHVQRFGAKTGYPEFMRDMRARRFLQAGGYGVTHYTSRALQRVIELKDKGMLASVATPEQAASLAVSIANQTFIEMGQGNVLGRATEFTTRACKGMGALKAVGRLQEIASASHLPHLREAAMIFFDAALAAIPAYNGNLRAALSRAHIAMKVTEKPKAGSAVNHG